ncbi:MAG: T9SS type A sorting domain-containing protein [Bacteroidota bacterium]|nr:T9SS type A sorting domain-containing protein [Bacteroidota bacterium]
MNKIITLFLLSFYLLINGQAQTPPWFFINTGAENTHIILILQSTPILLDDQPMEFGDYIAAFYEFTDTLLCATGTGSTGDIGGMMLVNEVAAATIWGAEPNVNNGFQVGEEFKWKIWRASDGSVFDAVVEYDTNIPNIPDSGLYVPNGISKMASLSSYSIPGIDLSVNKQLSPVSGCGTLEAQDVTILLENHDTLDIVGFNVYYTKDNGDTISAFVNDTIYAGSTYIYTFSQQVNLPYVNIYSFHTWVEYPGDVNYTNDYNNHEVIISNFPKVDLGDDVFICQGDTTLLQTDDFYESYLWNTGDTMQYLFTAVEGFYYCTITDVLGCQGFDSVFVDVLELPQFDLPDSVLFCEGLYANVEIEGRFESYKWSNGLENPNLYISMPGDFSVTVTDFAGCSSSASLVAIAVPVPVVDLGDTIYSDLIDTIILDAGPGHDSYLWSTGDIVRFLYPQNYGIYELTVSDGFCEGNDMVIIVKDTIRFFDDLHVWPNPTDGFLTLYLPKTKTLSIDIYSVMGQKVKSFYGMPTNIEILDVSFLGSGSYVFIFNTDDKKYQRRIIKVKIE